MKKKIIFVVAALLLILTSVTSGKSLGVPFEKIVINERIYFEYQTKSNFLLDPDVDRIRTLIEKLGESLNARVTLDESTKKIELIKPIVQIITANAIGTDKDNNNNNKLVFEGVFGKSKKGTKLDKFRVYTEIQDIPEGKVDFRLKVEVPNQSALALNSFAVTPEIVSTDKSDTTIFFDVANAHFTEEGSYFIKLQMRVEGEETFFTIAEKKIDVTK